MINWPHIYFFAFLGGAALSLMYTPIFQKIAEKIDLMDRPKSEKHKGHAKAIPLLGGAAMCCAWLTAIGIAVGMIDSGVASSISEGLREYSRNFLDSSLRLGVIVFGAVLVMMLGIIDDKHHLSAAVKFGGQFLVALLAVQFGGIKISCFIDSELISTAVTIFWFMVLMNSINFFDNMDGLAVGTVTIAMGFFALVATLHQQFFIATFAALNCGVCAGFWFYNTSPATIFMGDSGSHFLGYLTACVSASVTYFSPEFSLSRYPILFPLFVLAVPLFDTLSVVAIRTINRKPFWIGDHNHLSHRLVRLGMSRTYAVMLIHLLMLVVNLSVLPLIWAEHATALAILAQLVILFVFFTLLLNCHRSLPPQENNDNPKN